MWINDVYRKIKLYKWKEKETSYGDEYPDETFFVLRRYTNYNGIASHIIVFLGMLRYMEEKYPESIPIIDFQHYENAVSETASGTKNAWEDFFEQPNEHNIVIDDILKAKNVILANGYIDNKVYILPQDCDWQKLNNDGWVRIFKKYIKLNRKFEEEMNILWTEIVKDHNKILGVKARGTDYNQLKPSGHNIQPSIDEIFNVIDTYMQEIMYDGIYLATEDRVIFEAFHNRYGSLIVNSEIPIINYQGGIVTDARRKVSKHDVTKQYLNELYSLSKCESLISGINSGVIPVLLWNGGAFKRICLFDKGKY